MTHNTGNLGFKFFVIQIISVLITLILMLLKVTNTIDISWFVSVLPLVISVLGPILLSIGMVSFLGVLMILRKKNRKETKESLKKILKK